MSPKALNQREAGEVRESLDQFWRTRHPTQHSEKVELNDAVPNPAEAFQSDLPVINSLQAPSALAGPSCVFPLLPEIARRLAA